MEAGTLDQHQEDAERAVTFEGDEPEARDVIPAEVREAAEGKISEPGVEEVDATEWLLAADEPTEDEVQPVELKINLASPGQSPRIMSWWVVPLPGEEFRKFRTMAQPRRARRSGMPVLNDMNDERYHTLVVTAATVKPDLREIARSKGVNDPAEVLRHRFRHKPGLIAQISGMISDVSGYAEDDVQIAEKAAGNS
jgi:hypothetical protein